jgi:dienelactone hydrolase
LLLVLLGHVHAEDGTRREPVAFAPWGHADIAATTGELFLPPGKGPFAAVVILHGCGGIQENAYAWANELVRLGLAALVADHFTPRGVQRICERYGGRMVEQRERRRDTYGALRYLSERGDIDGKRIGIMGFSNGGLATVNALVAGLNDPADLRFKAGIALYPDCTGYIGLSVKAPLLILIGEKDDWAPASACRRLIDQLPAGSETVQMQVFPGAHHAFDVVGQRWYFLAQAVNPHRSSGFGATISFQAEAHQLAIQQVKIFFRHHLLEVPDLPAE